MTEYASLSKYSSKNVHVVKQVVNNRKVMAKTPREANLYGNWCVRKGLRRRSRQLVTASGFRSNGPRLESGRGRSVESLDKALYSHCAGSLHITFY